MNITFFIPHLRQPSGIERVLSIKANYLADVLGYNITIITYRQFNSPIFYPLSEKIKLVHFNIDDPSFKLKNYGFFKRNFLFRNFLKIYKEKITEFLRKNPQDILVSLCLGAEQYFLTNINDGSKKILEFHFGFEFGTLKGLDNKIPFYHFIKFYRTQQKKNKIERFDKIVVLTDADAVVWQNYFSKKKITVIPNPITIKPLRKPQLKNKSATAVGRLVHEKGFDMLLDVWEIVHKVHNDWSLNIYGSGELEEELKDKIIKKQLNNVIKINEPRKDIEVVYNQSSIFILSSRHEGFVLVLIEAMASGIPCVSFDCPNGPSELITNGKNGFLVAPNDVQEMAKKIILLIENPELRDKMSKASILRANDYSIEKIMSQWVELFTNL